MSKAHLGTHHEKYGRVPLCGQAMWDALVTISSCENECWECQTIVAGGRCPVCKGEGLVSIVTGGPDYFGNFDHDHVPCHACIGTGTVPTWDDHQEAHLT